LENFDTIKNSPPHIYHSALPFSPSSSWLCKCYNTDPSLTVKVVKGLPVEWGTCSRTVLLDSFTQTLSYWYETVAVGSEPGDIIILDAITGSQTAVLSGHTDKVNCITFSPDGTSLVSGSDDCTVKLWDVQTGGVAKTFSGHTERVWSISISADYTTIASGSADRTTCLWSIQTGECYYTIQQQDIVRHVSFSPINPQHLVSICDNKLWQWDTNGHQIKPPFDRSCVAFSPDGTQFVSCHGAATVVQVSHSGALVAEFQVASNNIQHCCFSPDSRLVAVATNSTVCVWDITNSEPHLVETLTGHSKNITSLAFSSPSTLISASQDKSVKFWQIGAPSVDRIATDQQSIPNTSSPIMSITLQTRDGIAISSDLGGVVKTWDISTGLCKASFQTPVKGKRDVRLVNGKLVVVWHEAEKGYTGDDEGRKGTKITGRIHIFDAERGELLQAVDTLEPRVRDLWIAEDGSRVFCLGEESVQAWFIQTGGAAGEVRFQNQLRPDSLTVGGLKVWAHFAHLPTQGWDFGIPGSPTPISNMAPNKPSLDITDSDTKKWSVGLPSIRCTATGVEVLQLPGRYARPSITQCSDKYFIAGYNSGEVVILDLGYLL
jgi:WD40 repeat protein